MRVDNAVSMIKGLQMLQMKLSSVSELKVFHKRSADPILIAASKATKFHEMPRRLIRYQKSLVSAPTREHRGKKGKESVLKMG
jgi:hypothetical protein